MWQVISSFRKPAEGFVPGPLAGRLRCAILVVDAVDAVDAVEEGEAREAVAPPFALGVRGRR